MEKDWIKIQDHGFEPGEILEDHYILGGVGDTKIPDEIINPSRDYRDKLPTFKDIQRQNGLETMNCTVYGTENGIQIFEKVKFGDDIDYDERTVGIGAGTTRTGGSPHNVCEWIRKNGMTSGVLPWTSDINTWNEYYSPKPLTQEIKDIAKKWVVTKDFKHRWLFRGGSLLYKQKKLWETLLKCAPGVSVRAWQFRNGKYYKEFGQNDNHWCTLVYGEWGKFWVVLDHYDNILKELEWDYNFSFAKQYHVKKNPPVFETKTDGEIDGKPIPKGSWVNGTDMWKWINKQIGYIGLVFKKIKGR